MPITTVQLDQEAINANDENPVDYQLAAEAVGQALINLGSMVRPSLGSSSEVTAQLERGQFRYRVVWRNGESNGNLTCKEAIDMLVRSMVADRKRADIRATANRDLIRAVATHQEDGASATAVPLTHAKGTVFARVPDDVELVYDVKIDGVTTFGLGKAAAIDLILGDSENTL